MKIVECSKTHNLLKVMKEVEEVSNYVVPNSVEAAREKHIPECLVEGDSVFIKVNHVMEEDHYIEWILVDYGDMEITKYFKAGDEASITVDYKDNMKVYAYCNKHGLWVNEEVK